ERRVKRPAVQLDEHLTRSDVISFTDADPRHDAADLWASIRGLDRLDRSGRRELEGNGTPLDLGDGDGDPWIPPGDLLGAAGVEKRDDREQQRDPTDAHGHGERDLQLAESNGRKRIHAP